MGKWILFGQVDADKTEWRVGRVAVENQRLLSALHRGAGRCAFVPPEIHRHLRYHDDQFRKRNAEAVGEAAWELRRIVAR